MKIEETTRANATTGKQECYFVNYFTALVKFTYSEKATYFCKISTIGLPYLVLVKSRVEISQNFVAFSEYMNFTSTEEETSNRLILLLNCFIFSEDM